MNLLLAAMAVSIVLGMIFRKQERVLRILMMLLSIGVTTLYFVFADRMM
jgi:hypothetical protein